MSASFDSTDRAGVGTIHLVAESEEILAICTEGEFDLSNARVLDEQIGRALETGNDVILDLSEATFIDSSVLSVLIRASQTAGRRGRAMVLQLGTAAVVERALDLGGIYRALPRAHDRQEARRIIMEQRGIAYARAVGGGD